MSQPTFLKQREKVTAPIAAAELILMPIAQDAVSVSVRRQASENRELAKEENLQVIATFHVPEVPGGIAFFSAEMSEILRFIQARSIKAIVSTDLDELAQPKTLAQALLLQALVDNGIDLFASDGRVDFSNSTRTLNLSEPEQWEEPPAEE